MKKIRINKKVIVAMSGGVDSSVSAAILKEKGFDVIGVFMKFWKDGKSGTNRCCSSDSEKMARIVSKKIGIPFYVFNFEKEFKKKVVDYFIKSIEEGITPNPCVVCNKEIKLGLLIEKSIRIGADYVATGHYARKLKNSILKGYKLLKGKDKAKDQSYFLWKINQKQLERLIFPVGIYRKEEVRKLAKKFDLPNFNASESMEICFIPRTVNEFIKKYVKEKKGDIILNGKKIGEHQGAFLYTIGQRKGIKLPSGPYYVIKKDIKKNIIFVSKDKKFLMKKDVFIKDTNWISGKRDFLNFKITAKSRYNGKSFLVFLKGNKVIFNKPQESITSGQSMVFYKGEELLGGGVIN